MVLFKKGVRIDHLTPALCHILSRLEEFNRNPGPLDDFPIDFVITSVADGVHMKESQHYKGSAIDIRSKNFFNEETKKDFRAKFEKFLGLSFRVLYENVGQTTEHFHVQVKKGMRYP